MNHAVVLNASGEESETIPLQSPVFNEPVREHLIHQVVVAKLSSTHQGTHSTKTRGDVSGSGKKLWKQKGTGRARIGSIRSPVWKGGGIAFGPHPRSRKKAINVKARRRALFSLLSQKARLNKVILVPAYPEGDTPSTRTSVDWLSRMGLLDEKILLVDEKYNKTLGLSLRNIQNVSYTTINKLNILDTFKAKKLIFTRASLDGWCKTMEGLS